MEDSEGDVPVTFADLGVRSEAATVETFVGTVKYLRVGAYSKSHHSFNKLKFCIF